LKLFQITFFVAVAASLGALSGWHYARTPDLPTVSDIRKALLDKQPAKMAEPVLPAKFHWAQIADEDLKKYIANLRLAQCPDAAIKSVIRGIVLRMYQAKVNEIFNPLAHFWESAAEAAAMDRKIKAIRAERDKLLASLGIGFDEDEGLELPAEKQSLVNKAHELYPSVTPKPGSSWEDWAGFRDSRRARVNYLAQFLTPEELLDYRINHDGNAQRIGKTLENLNYTDEEFKKVFLALDGEDTSRTNGYMRTDLEAKLKLALGDERYTEYHEQATPASLMLNSFAEMNRLNADQKKQLNEIRTTFGGSVSSSNDKNYRKAISEVIGDRLTDRYFDNPVLYQTTK
jgi:hypothetical protein